MNSKLRNMTWPAILIACALTAVPTRADVRARPSVSTPQAAFEVAQAYLRAVQRRDFAMAYGYMSSADRSVRDKHAYLRGEPSLSGFALELARWFAKEMEVWIVEEHLKQNHARLEVGFRLPSGDEVAPQVFEWNPDKLNALTPKEQGAIFDALEKTKSSGKMIMVEGRATVDLVRERQGWKIFEDWRSRQRVRFESSQPKPEKLAVKFLRNDVLVPREEPFQVDFKVINESDREVWLKVSHSFTPRHVDKSIDMIACGSLVPFRLGPRQTREVSSTYILRSGVSNKAPLSIIYEFTPVADESLPSRK
jgi:hypothetical protein